MAKKKLPPKTTEDPEWQGKDPEWQGIAAAAEEKIESGEDPETVWRSVALALFAELQTERVFAQAWRRIAEAQANLRGKELQAPEARRVPEATRKRPALRLVRRSDRR